MDERIKKRLAEMVSQHREVSREEKTQTLLALAYEAPSESDGKDVVLFEVIDGFGSGEVSYGETMFQVAYDGKDALPEMGLRHLVMVLTNPAEVDAAANGGWSQLTALRNAIIAGDAVMLYKEGKGEAYYETIRTAA